MSQPAPMRLWIIRHKPTGKHLPQPQGRRFRGFTHTEPVAFDGKPEHLPRLFGNPHTAQRALTSWLKGKVCVSYDYEGALDSWKVKTCVDRHPEDMEIVPILLSDYVERELDF